MCKTLRFNEGCQIPEVGRVGIEGLRETNGKREETAGIEVLIECKVEDIKEVRGKWGTGDWGNERYQG